MYYSLITLGLLCNGIACTPDKDIRVFYVIDNSFLAYRIMISACFTWTDNSYLTIIKKASNNVLRHPVLNITPLEHWSKRKPTVEPHWT